MILQRALDECLSELSAARIWAGYSESSIQDIINLERRMKIIQIAFELKAKESAKVAELVESNRND